MTHPPDEAQRDVGTYEALRAQLWREAPGEVEGLFGPGSLSWTLLRELALAFGAGRVLLLQLAHPAVSAGVRQHSAYATDTLGRSVRTFAAVYRILFGTRTDALGTADRVHQGHRRVQGALGPERPEARYRALDPELLLWVHATLVDTVYVVYPLLLRPLTHVEKTRFYEESHVFSAAFGLPRSAVPPTYDAFQAYMRQMLHGPALRAGAEERQMRAQLVVDANIPKLLNGLLQSEELPLAGALFSLPLLPRTLRRVFELSTAGLLPPRLAAEYRLPFGPLERAELAALVPVLRAAIAVTPPAVRFVPAYHRAVARVAAARGERPPLQSRTHLWLWDKARTLGAGEGARR